MIHRYHWHSNCLKPVLRFVIIGGITSSFLQNTVFTCLSRFAWFWAADSTRFTASCVFASGYPTYGCWQLNVCLHLIELFFFFSPISFRLSECDVRKTDKGQKPFFFSAHPHNRISSILHPHTCRSSYSSFLLSTSSFPSFVSSC